MAASNSTPEGTADRDTGPTLPRRYATADNGPLSNLDIYDEIDAHLAKARGIVFLAMEYARDRGDGSEEKHQEPEVGALWSVMHHIDDIEILTHELNSRRRGGATKRNPL